MDSEDVHDHGRVRGDVRSYGVVAPEVNPGVRGAQGEVILEGPILEDVQRRVTQSAEQERGHRRAGYFQITRKENRVDENHDGKSRAEEVSEEGKRGADEHLMRG